VSAIAIPGNDAFACDAVRTIEFANTQIVSVERVAAGKFSVPGRGPGAAGRGAAFAELPEFCRIAATARPSSDSEINFEVWMPTAGWNGMLQSVGNGAWAGSISYPALAAALRNGYAAASTDTGHIGNNVDFAVGHPEKLVDFAHRAVHEMTVAAKQIVTKHYGRPSDYDYFVGCSTGGRQALAETQRYPDDYDGIVSGAPAYYPTHIQGMQVWTGAITHKQEGAAIGEREFEIVNEAAVAACDLLDGVQDGVLENPTHCEFDPATLICNAANAGSCLTAAQANTVAQIYRGPVDANGQSIFPGLPRGSEIGWRTLSGADPLSLAFDTYAQLVYNDPNWDFRTFEPIRDFAVAERRIGALMNSDDAEISPFVSAGGKLLMYHGWSDPGIPAEGSVRYYERVVDMLGAGTADNGVRLFMVPGMGHCRGGVGTDQFDAVAALDQWVRTDKPPARIEAARVEDGDTKRTRPLCAYPSMAVYDGSGSTDASENFQCK
jgi:feruloyl esterase